MDVFCQNFPLAPICQATIPVGADGQPDPTGDGPAATRTRVDDPLAATAIPTLLPNVTLPGAESIDSETIPVVPTDTSVPPTLSPIMMTTLDTSTRMIITTRPSSVVVSSTVVSSPSSSTTQSAVAASTSAQPAHKGTGAGLVVGVVAAVIAGLVLLSYIFVVVRKKQKRREEDKALNSYTGGGDIIRAGRLSRDQLLAGHHSDSGHSTASLDSMAKDQPISRFSEYTQSGHTQTTEPNRMSEVRTSRQMPVYRPYSINGASRSSVPASFEKAVETPIQSDSSHEQAAPPHAHVNESSGRSPPRAAFGAPRESRQAMNGSYPIEERFSSVPLAFSAYSSAILPEESSHSRGESLTDPFAPPPVPRNSVAPLIKARQRKSAASMGGQPVKPLPNPHDSAMGEDEDYAFMEDLIRQEDVSVNRPV